MMALPVLVLSVLFAPNHLYLRLLLPQMLLDCFLHWCWVLLLLLAVAAVQCCLLLLLHCHLLVQRCHNAPAAPAAAPLAAKHTYTQEHAQIQCNVSDRAAAPQTSPAYSPMAGSGTTLYCQCGGGLPVPSVTTLSAQTSHLVHSQGRPRLMLLVLPQGCLHCNPCVHIDVSKQYNLNVSSKAQQQEVVLHLKPHQQHAGQVDDNVHQPIYSLLPSAGYH